MKDMIRGSYVLCVKIVKNHFKALLGISKRLNSIRFIEFTIAKGLVLNLDGCQKKVNKRIT